MEHEKPYSVYVKTDETGRIVAVNSDAFLPSTDGWEKIAEGHGDKFHHAQGNFFPLPLTDENGVFRYKLENGQPIERTPEEMAEDRQGQQAQQVHTLEERVDELDEALSLILSGVTE